jgi:hypothetical protein
MAMKEIESGALGLKLGLSTTSAMRVLYLR